MMTLPKLPLSVLLSLASVSLGSSMFLFYLAYTTTPHVAAPAPVAAYPKSFSLPQNALEAKSAIVYDPATKRVLYAKNADASMALASLTKLMTAQAVLASVATDTMITVTQDDLATDGDAGDIGFAAGDVVKLADLIKFGLIASSND